MDPVSGSGPVAQNWRNLSGLGEASNPLTLEEIVALRRSYSTDEVASTVSLDLEDTPSPTVIPASALTLDSVIMFADPIPVPGVEPDHHQDIPNPIDRLVQREKDHKIRVDTFSNPMAKFHAMDLFDINYYVSNL